ncbi:DUF1700 domain-containing protein [Sedimentibacter sp. zth1]|uniref:DUF1700 domain-containing protein n=1 Tax=Sedimentibacter sp. zth1 TaxID=2816908 RepID=UPI001A92FCA1|nr:DUF1700 domain-containing protein [Sedimentibacter sp. zth1]QSX05951.1 DUF1700 domain-containing protein [Sedimentibacter sp. zth1]
MDRKQFIVGLREQLMCLPHDEREKAISYYEEYFDDAGVENEASVLAELGDVSKIAKEIIENSTTTLESVSKNKYSSSNNYSQHTKNMGSNNNSNNSKNGHSYNYSYSYSKDKNNKSGNGNSNLKPLWIILCIIGCIVALPIILSIFGLVVGLIGTIIGLVFSSIGLAISLIVGIVAVPFTGIAVIGKILFSLGKGLVGVVLLILIIIGIIKLVQVIRNYFENRNRA